MIFCQSSVSSFQGESIWERGVLVIKKKKVQPLPLSHNPSASQSQSQIGPCVRNLSLLVKGLLEFQLFFRQLAKEAVFSFHFFPLM